MVRQILIGALLFAGPSFFGGVAMAEPVPVELRQTDQGWQLLRGGEPYFIRGAGGSQSLNLFAAAGGNSTRTWGAETPDGEDSVGELLDEAHALGLTVTLGIWLGHERHGFDYDDEAQVAGQLERVRRIVLRHRNHPALLLWGIGNEMEGFDAGDDPAIWRAVNDAAALVKELDPNHPTMTVTAFVHGERIRYVHEVCDAIDIHGINAYGGALAVPELLEDAGAAKPYILTEFGPPGPWETAESDWGAPFEQNSTDKAAFYRRAYTAAIESAPGRALGSYAFLWGNKMEATDTWFGMFLDDGAATEAVDTMTEIWSGKPPDNRAPAIGALNVVPDLRAKPGALIRAEVDVSDPEGAPLTSRWVLRRESDEYLTGGDARPLPPAFPDAIVESSVDTATFAAPEYPGSYRLFYFAYDDNGKAATANLPIMVEGEPRTPLPYPVFDDSLADGSWAPSGWMGDTDKLSLNGDFPDAHDGDRAIRIRFEGVFGWAGIAWQHPANNWGDIDDGIDMTGASALEFWARGEYGGEKIGFGVGLLEEDTRYPDSSVSKVEDVTLTADWQRFRVPLKRKDLSSLKTGFYLTLVGRRSPVTVYLDRVQFVE